MMPASPEYQLYSESTKGDQPGRWRFVLRANDGSDPLVAEDVEPDVQGERLELLSVVRGLEALDQPSRVTLMTPSVYVREGIRYGLEEWRSNDWQWESFGRMVPVKNGDLWQRVDRAMGFHEVECHTRRFDPPHQTVSPPHTGAAASTRTAAGVLGWLIPPWQRLVAGSGRRIAHRLRELGRVACA
jgi:ribonuclease HI